MPKGQKSRKQKNGDASHDVAVTATPAKLIDFKSDLVDVGGADFSQVILVKICERMQSYFGYKEAMQTIYEGISTDSFESSQLPLMTDENFQHMIKLSGFPVHVKFSIEVTTMLKIVLPPLIEKWANNHTRNPFRNDPMLRLCNMEITRHQLAEKLAHFPGLNTERAIQSMLFRPSCTHLFLVDIWPVVAMIRAQYPLTKIDAGFEFERKLFMELWYNRIVLGEFQQALEREDQKYAETNPSREPTKFSQQLVADDVTIFYDKHPVHHLQSTIIPRLVLSSVAYHQALQVLYLELVIRICYSSDYYQKELSEIMIRHVCLWLRKSLAKSLVWHMDKKHAKNNGSSPMAISVLETVFIHSPLVKQLTPVVVDGRNEFESKSVKSSLPQVDTRFGEIFGFEFEIAEGASHSKKPLSKMTPLSSSQDLYERFFFSQKPRQIYKAIGHLSLPNDAKNLNVIYSVRGEIPHDYEFLEPATFLTQLWPEYKNIDFTIAQPEHTSMPCHILEAQLLTMSALFAESPAFTSLPLCEKLSDGDSIQFNYCKASFSTKLIEMMINNFNLPWHYSSVHSALQWSVGESDKVDKSSAPIIKTIHSTMASIRAQFSDIVAKLSSNT